MKIDPMYLDEMCDTMGGERREEERKGGAE
jgi:hypothetical protein